MTEPKLYERRCGFCGAYDDGTVDEDEVCHTYASGGAHPHRFGYFEVRRTPAVSREELEKRLVDWLWERRPRLITTHTVEEYASEIASLLLQEPEP